jgi:hypothetical protein
VGGRRPYVPVIGPGAPGVTAAWVTRSNFRIARASQVQTNGDLRSWVDPCTNAPPTAH